MAENHSKKPQGDGSDQGFGEHVAALAGGIGGAGVAEVLLAMSDLIADDQGEIVFFNDSNARRLVVSTNAAVVAEGQSGRHRTSAGEDVSGYRFVAFDSGVKLYYQSGLDLVVRAEPS